MPDKEKVERRIEEGEFNLLLSQIANSIANELAHIENIPHQIAEYEANGYRIVYYLDKDGNPAFRPVKKEHMGFKT